MFYFQSVGSVPLAKFKQLVSVLGIPFITWLKKSNYPAHTRLSGVTPVLLLTALNTLLCFFLFFVLDIAAVQKFIWASSVWAVMKVEPRFCLPHKSALPSLTHRPLFTLIAVSLVTSQQQHCFHWLLQRRPSHFSPRCHPTSESTHTHSSSGRPMVAPRGLESEKFRGSSLIPGWCVSAAASSNPCAECLQSTGGLGTTSKPNPCK